MRTSCLSLCALGFLAIACGRDGLLKRRPPDGAVAGSDSSPAAADSGTRTSDAVRTPDGAGEMGGGDGALSVVPWRLTCGNGVLDPGESCDDGNRRPGDGCGQNCCQEFNFSCCDHTGCWEAEHRPCHCGDGFVEPGEQCDDGNLIFGDGCSGYCEIETGRCGNGVLDPGEECDDGNLLFGDGQYGDGCDPSCRRERIGCFPSDAGR